LFPITVLVLYAHDHSHLPNLSVFSLILWQWFEGWVFLKVCLDEDTLFRNIGCVQLNFVSWLLRTYSNMLFQFVERCYVSVHNSVSEANKISFENNLCNICHLSCNCFERKESGRVNEGKTCLGGWEHFLKREQHVVINIWQNWE
jgi:hypothetical protein